MSRQEAIEKTRQFGARFAHRVLDILETPCNVHDCDEPRVDGVYCGRHGNRSRARLHYRRYGCWPEWYEPEDLQEDANV